MARLFSLSQNKVYPIRTGLELQQAYRIDPTLPLRFSCCNGECGVCVVEVKEGEENLSKMTRQELATLAAKQFGPTCRLACQCAILGDVVIS